MVRGRRGFSAWELRRRRDRYGKSFKTGTRDMEMVLTREVYSHCCILPLVDVQDFSASGSAGL